MSSLPLIKTPRLQLVPFEKKKHLKQWYRWFQNEHVLYWLSCPRVPSKKMVQFSRRFLRQKFNDAQANYGVAIETQEGKHIGNIRINTHFEFSLEIGDVEYWNRGYGSEAMQGFLRVYDQQCQKDLWLWVFDFNERAIQLYLKFGFVFTGLSEQGFYRGGQFPCSHLQFKRLSPR